MNLQLGIFDSVNRVELFVYGMPVVIWGAGAAEGIVRTVIESSKVVFKMILGQTVEGNIDRVKNEFLITKGCLVLTGLSSFPLIVKVIPYGSYILSIPGFYITYKTYVEIDNQTRKYHQFKYAIERAKWSLATRQASTLADRVCNLKNSQELDALIKGVERQLEQPERVTQEDLDAMGRRLEGTLIYRNWSYTATYFAMEKTYTTTFWMAGKVTLLASRILNMDSFQRAARFVATEIGTELMTVLDLPEIPRRPRD